MRFKTKYNVGDIVKFYNRKICNYDVGEITSVGVDFSWETLQRTKYMINPAKLEYEVFDHSISVDQSDVCKRLHKDTFEKEYAKLCAKIKLSGENK